MTTEHSLAEADSLARAKEQALPAFDAGDSTARKPRVFLRDMVWLCRPAQWTKNVFVIAPLIFSPQLLSLSSVVTAVLAVACFCLWSSSVYLLNDVLDAESDRRHPRKCERPVAAGRVSPRMAIFLSLLLTTVGIVSATVTLPQSFLLAGGFYLANSVLYCVVLKTRVIADVLSIAIGFVLRLLAGCAAIGVEPSSWIVVCGFSMALLLAFGKRRAELVRLSNGADMRSTLASYSQSKLDTMLGVSSALCLLSYMLYTVAPTTVAEHHTGNLIYTVPFVAYGVFRYVFLVQEGAGDGPTEILVKGYVFFLNGLLWGLAVLTILYMA